LGRPGDPGSPRRRGSMDQKVFERFSRIAYQEAGIHLSEAKKTLVSSRISKRMRALGLSREMDYLALLEKDPKGEEKNRFLDAITTNYTRFMREGDHFQFLSEWAKRAERQGKTRFRIWCAAAASGEEPYSIAVTMLEALGNRKADLKILATDISEESLAQAKEGVYSLQAVQPLTKAQKIKYFEKEKGREGETLFRVKREVREIILFRKLNLAKPPYPLKGPLDAIFCRNVMIYFQNHTRQGIVREAERLLRPAGLFIIGHSDTLAGVQTELVTIRPSLFMKRAEGRHTN